MLPRVSAIATAADFALPDTAGATHRLSDLTADGPVVVVFTGDRCPYARAWHERLADLADDYAPRGVHVLFVNAEDGAADTLEAMRRRVAEERWTVPYLHDAAQEVARQFGAQVTPEVFVVDRDMQVRYHGAPDQDHEDPAANGLWVREALDDVLSGVELRRPETEPVGSPIAWRA
jgi:peroxiredoxin